MKESLSTRRIDSTTAGDRGREPVPSSEPRSVRVFGPSPGLFDPYRLRFGRLCAIGAKSWDVAQDHDSADRILDSRDRSYFFRGLTFEDKLLSRPTSIGICIGYVSFFSKCKRYKKFTLWDRIMRICSIKLYSWQSLSLMHSTYRK